MSGQIVDATLVAAPRQRNTDEEKAEIKAGRIPAEWQARPAKLRHKDRDARWTVKFTKAKPDADGTMPATDLAIPVFGYQNHVGIDRGFGFIRTWAATDAAAYEGRLLREGLLDKTNTAGAVWADTAYRSKANERFMAENGFVSRVHRKKPPGRPMPVRTRSRQWRASRRCVPASSTSSPSRRAAWGCSSAPLAWRERARRSGWPTSSTTSNGCLCWSNRQPSPPAEDPQAHQSRTELSARRHPAGPPTGI